MKSVIKKTSKRAAFTIIELLTVMSIIVILFGLLAPAMTMVRRHAKRVKQEAQFHSIEAGLQMFHDDFDGYPDSGEKDDGGIDYPGAMKLAEAMVGQDMLGFHPMSKFNRDGTNSAVTALGSDLYPAFSDPITVGDETENLRSRRGPYVPVDQANVYTLTDLYADLGPLLSGTDPNLVLCDEYPRARSNSTGKRIGMPILYYKADISKIEHDNTTEALNIYAYSDNQKIIERGLPWGPGVHPLDELSGESPKGKELFYETIRNKKISSIDRPYRPESYILISAGFDGLYGTEDDIYNFED